MKKKTETRKPGKSSSRFTKEDRERVKEVLRPEFKRVYGGFLALEGKAQQEIPSAAERRIPHIGGDWRLTDEPDDGHNIPFPLRVDRDIRTVQGAVKVLFPDEAGTLRKNIVAYIERAKTEKRKWKQEGEQWTRAVLGRDGFIRHAWMLFGAGHLAGETLLNVLTPDTQSRIRQGGMKPDRLRVTADFAAKVISDLLVEECGVSRKYVDDQKLEKRFKAMPID